VLPLPRKSIPKEDETRAKKMEYVIEIQGTTWKPHETSIKLITQRSKVQILPPQPKLLPDQ
jgi:hypothetical protein